MKKFYILVCLLGITMAFASCGDLQNEITIYGNVIDRTTGHPLYNVLIEEKKNVGGSTVTGSDGSYEFTLPLNGSSDGKYYLVASKNKYSSSEYELDVRSINKNRKVKVDFLLTSEFIFYTGKVSDIQNNPIVDAKVSATFEYIDISYNVYGIGTTAITDINGSYSLELPRPHERNNEYSAALDQWQFNIIASKSGYTADKHVLNQNKDDMGKTITLNFVLGSN